MCLLVSLRRDGDLWVAANRDESRERPWEAPALLTADPPVFGGRDVLAGGSWLAVNLSVSGPFAVAVTNARRGAPRGERSRGQLVLDTATQRTVGGAVALLAELDLSRFGPFNLLLADAGGAFLATNTPAPALRQSSEALVAIGNELLDDPGPRTRIAAAQAGDVASLAGDELAAALIRLLADHTGEDPFCRHGGRYGTVCSTLLRLSARGLAEYLFAPGPPCVAPFRRVVVPVTS